MEAVLVSRPSVSSLPVVGSVTHAEAGPRLPHGPSLCRPPYQPGQAQHTTGRPAPARRVPGALLCRVTRPCPPHHASPHRRSPWPSGSAVFSGRTQTITDTHGHTPLIPKPGAASCWRVMSLTGSCTAPCQQQQQQQVTCSLIDWWPRQLPSAPRRPATVPPRTAWHSPGTLALPGPAWRRHLHWATHASLSELFSPWRHGPLCGPHCPDSAATELGCHTVPRVPRLATASNSPVLSATASGRLMPP